MPRKIKVDGVIHSFPDDATDAEISAALNGPATQPTPTAQPDESGMIADAAAGGSPVAPGQKLGSRAALGFEQGVGNFLGNVADLAGEVPGVPELFQSATGHTLAESTDNLRNPAHAPDVKPDVAGRVFADGLLTAPLAAVFPPSFWGNVAAGAVTTALTSDKDKQADGAALGGFIGGATHGLSRAISPQPLPGATQTDIMRHNAVVNLHDAGTTLTPGQIFGGWVKGMEDRVAGLPIVGDVVRHAQRNSMREAANGAVNTTLEPLSAVGGPVPVGPGVLAPGTPLPSIPVPPAELPPGMVGQTSVRFAGDTLSDAYDSILPHTQTLLEPQFWAGVQQRVNSAAARVLPGHEDQLRSTVADVFSKLGPVSPHTQIDGATMKMLDSEFGNLGRNFSGTADNVNNGPLADVFNGIRADLRGAVAASNPTLAPQLSAVNQGYARLVPIEDAAGNAAGNAAGMDRGVFSGHQLRQSTERYADQTVRHRGMGRGTVPGQQYAEDMISILPSSVPDSGTAGRWLLPAVATGAAPFSAPAAVAAASVPLAYSKPVLGAMNAVYARNAGPGATALADVFRNAGRYSAPFTAQRSGK